MSVCRYCGREPRGDEAVRTAKVHVVDAEVPAPARAAEVQSILVHFRGETAWHSAVTGREIRTVGTDLVLEVAVVTDVAADSTENGGRA